MCDKMAISAYILKIVEKDPFLRLQMRAKEMFNRHHYPIISEYIFLEKPYTMFVTYYLIILE